ncbi:MAG: 2'-5' RNA ligase family protein, partial [Acidimicrobiales bacterium]
MADRPSASSVGGTGRRSKSQLRAILTRCHLIGVARLIDRAARRVAIAGVNVLNKFTRLPLVGTYLNPLVARLEKGDRLYFDQAELIRVCSALNDAHLPFWVTGGWGLDVLVSCETRRHDDLDFALDRFGENLPAAAAVLTRLGYQRKEPLTGTMWFPDAEIYEDGHGHHIEVHSINWAALSTSEALLDPQQKTDSVSNNSPTWATPRLLEQCTTVGSLDGVPIPTLSVVAQRLFHQGYERRPKDWNAEDIMHMISMGDNAGINTLEAELPRSGRGNRTPSTLLLVPVLTLPSDLWRLCRLYHNDLSRMPPHITLAFPFLPRQSITPDVMRDLSNLVRETPAFDFELSQVRWFGTDVVYVEPSKSDTFRSIVETLQRMFPDFHPYDDAFESVIPHLCLSEHGTLSDRRALGRRAVEYLPAPARATHVWMMSNER